LEAAAAGVDHVDECPLLCPSRLHHSLSPRFRSGAYSPNVTVRRTLKISIAAFVIAAALLALGIYTANLLMSVVFGVATMLMAIALALAWGPYRTERRLERGWRPD
jgi:hypothetical protein